MMDFNSFLKIQESVKEIINKTLPGINQDAINTISVNLTMLVQREIYNFSGCKVPFDTYREIHAKWLSGIKQIELAEEYKLNLNTINKICNDKLIVRRR